VIKADALAAGASVYSEVVAQDRRSSTSYGGDAVIGGNTRHGEQFAVKWRCL